MTSKELKVKRQEEVIKKWNEIKIDSDFPAKISNLLQEYRTISINAEN